MGVNLAGRLRTLAWATLIANIVIVVTGGAVRLTGSGLGCPTWPRCTDDALTPRHALTAHSAIEFGNRSLTFVLTAIAVLTFIAAYQAVKAGGRTQLRTVAFWLALSIPAQAVLGGITVKTHLNPWVVGFHLLFSMSIIGLAAVYIRMMDGPLPAPTAGRPVTLLAWAMGAAGVAVLVVGTIVTGSGPHAGDDHSKRNGLSPLQLSQLHADLVFLFVGLTIGLLFVLWATGARPEALRAARLLLIVEIAQGAIGFVQYFTHLPVVLVGFHMLGAALIMAVMTWTVLSTREA
ncbi:COX15/CtaA family protein [Nocardioides marmorisolisilvae]|uniref:Heme A synthase n=1 Tax=Nocardioides marmorisolisilvae TaxID=1542737 RepID=A0A3N0DUX6_9ACTN|nr:COX15/CtaA family protein [Nocardioides marmorisolisilvae]RNL79427.1 heme A synthase [Nocardioides marmorisolisilvae]